MSTRNEEYFAAREAKDMAGVVLSKAHKWFHTLDVNGYLDKLKEAWSAYHGAYYTDIGSGHRITFSGEQGELTNLPVNHYRNICRHILTMVTASRPSMQARATNTDYKSLVQTKLANGLLDYYMREKRLEDYLHRAIEYGIVFGSGYVKMEWNATTGEIYDYNEETETPIYEGDVQFSNLSPFDVVFDSTKEDSSQHDWVLCRSFKNRFDLAAKYPEQADSILRMETKDQKERYDFNGAFYDESDDIAVYEFYHKRTEAMPEGRYSMFVDADVVLVDAPMPYRELPVYRVSPADILGTPYGYSDTFDVLPIQDALNSMYSAILSNQNAFAVQSILSPRGSDISAEQVSSGMNFIEYNSQVGKPEPLQLTATSPQTFEFISLLERTAETISGVNSVSRGNPESSLKSGNALALVQSMSLQFVSGLQQSYVKMIEDVGTGLIHMLRDFAAVPRVAMIVGESNRSYMKEFVGDDLSSVNRVIVDVGNPLARCLAKDTPVLMHDGAIKMVQDIEVGDKIMGPDSKSRTVNAVNTGKEMMYKIISKDKHQKVEYGCNESHILTLKYCSDDPRYNAKKDDIVDITVRDYLKLPKRHKKILQGFKSGVEFTEKNMDLPPYILGAWLGDGHHDAAALTTMDDELLTEWTNYAYSVGMNVRVSTNNNCGNAKIYFITSGERHEKSDRNPLINELKQLEVWKNKHIPKYYLTSSRKQRLELLAGLLDTDGYLNGETFIITQKSDKLTEDIVYLSRSLGFRTTFKKVKSNSSEIVGEIDGYVNKITIDGDTWEIPTRLKRKQSQQKEKAQNWLNYGIDVVEVGYGDYYGFTLEEEPHFLLGDFTVTHNTTAGRVQMAEQLLQMGVITTPEHYIGIINHGKIETMTDGVEKQLLLTKAENEKLISGIKPVAVFTEPHSLHIKEHRDVLSDPDLKNDPELVMRVQAHIQEHIELLRSTDPATLQMLGEQPLAPVGAPPPNMPTPDQMVNQSAIDQQSPQNTPPPQPVAQAGSIPQPATPPEPFENMPTSGQDLLPES